MANQNFNGEILHCNAVRLRVVGEGDLKQSLFSLDDTTTFEMADYEMVPTTNRELSTLANFKDQRIQYEFKTEDFGAVFNISKIVVYIRPVETGYPQ